VFHKHANFIVNYGEATAADVRTLAAKLKEKVFDLFGITLEEEVLYIGA
jgi:UDP-N-acetylmuramate dehydrogenase